MIFLTKCDLSLPILQIIRPLGKCYSYPTFSSPWGSRLHDDSPAIEWPTLLLLVATYGLWAIGTTQAFEISAFLGILLTGLAIAQFSSLQHEILHGHPFRSRALNEALAFPALTLTVPYGRFRDTHLATTTTRS